MLIEYLNLLDNFKEYRNSNSSIEKVLEFKKINFFIGANNSGKSRFLRKIFYEDYEFISSILDIKEPESVNMISSEIMKYSLENELSEEIKVKSYLLSKGTSYRSDGQSILYHEKNIEWLGYLSEHHSR